MPIPSDVLETVRESGYQYVQPTYNYWPKQVVAQGTLTATPLTYPIGRLDVTWTSGTYASIRVGQLWIVRDVSTGDLVSYGVVRLAPTSSILYIDGKSRGDSGLAVAQAYGLTLGQTVTVYTIQPMWSLLSRIVSGQFYKKFDVPYDGSGSNPSPVLNIGKWRQAYADEYGYASFNFNTTNSFAWGSKTLGVPTWTLPAEAIITSGTINSTEITFKLPQGFYLVRCSIGDSGTATSIATRPVWVNGDDFPALSDEVGYEIGSDSQSEVGRSQTLKIYGQLDRDLYLPGLPILYTERAVYDGEELPSNILVDTFVGYTTDESLLQDKYAGTQATEFIVNSAWQWFEMIPMVSQAIVETASPSKWTDIGSGLGTPDFIAWYILKHHTTYLELFDYMPLRELNSVRKLNWGINGSTVADYLTYIGKTVGANVGCVSEGALYIRRDPNKEESPFRNELDVRMTITVDPDEGICDITESVEIPQRLLPNVGQLKVFVLTYNGTTTTAYGSIAPGFTQLQAPGSQDEDSFIIKPTSTFQPNEFGWELGGQDKANALSGHLLAKNNNPIPEINLALSRNMDFFDPAKMLWVRLEIPQDWSPRNEAINTRALPKTIDRSWAAATKGTFTKTITMTVTPETFGQPGETFLIDKGGGTKYQPQVPPSGQNNEEEDLMEDVTPFLVAISETGRMGRTTNGINWIDVQGNMTGRVQDFDFDYFSPYVNSGFVEGNLGAWAVTATRNTSDAATVFAQAEIWYTPNVLSNKVTWTRQYMIHKTCDLQNALRIIVNQDVQNYAAVTIADNKGVQLVRTIDGTSWNMLQVADNYGLSNLPFINNPADLVFNGQELVTSGWHNSSGAYKLVRFSTTTGGGTVFSGGPSSTIPWPSIRVNPDDEYVFATRVLRAVNTTPGTMSLTVNSSNVPTLTFSGGLTAPMVSVTIDGTPPMDTYAFIEAGNTTPSVYPKTCAQGPSAPMLESGWRMHDNPAIEYPEAPPKIYLSDYYHGWVGAVDHRGWVQVEVKFNGSATVTDMSQYGEWLVTSPSLGSTCSAVVATSPVHQFERFAAGGFHLRVEVNSGGNNDPDGTQASDLFTTESTAIVVGTFRTLGAPPTHYPVFMYGGFFLSTSKTTIDTPETYRVTNVSGGSPTFTSLSMPDDRHPLNPMSLCYDSINGQLVGALKQPTGLVTSRIADALFDGTDWVAMEDEVFLHGIVQNGDYGTAWGYERILITKDAWESSVNVVGDWAAHLGAIGTFKQVKGVLF